MLLGDLFCSVVVGWQHCTATGRAPDESWVLGLEPQIDLRREGRPTPIVKDDKSGSK